MHDIKDVVPRARARAARHVRRCGRRRQPEKQEIEPALLARSTLVVDSMAQCAEIGELHHAIEAKIATRDHVRASLGEVVAGLRTGRTTQDETIVFDSSGIAIEDVAAAVVVYEAALRENRGLRFAIAA
jgi:ornithine cyclodeaminase/alanine dehydrogenase-like protein (mu-crystallin family)